MTPDIPKQSPSPLKHVILVYPGFTLLDLAGPPAVPGIHSHPLRDT